MSKTKSTVGGAVGGAAAGAPFGPWGALAGGIGGGLYGFLSGSEDDKREGWNKDASTWAMGQYGNLGQYIQGMGQQFQQMYSPVMGAANTYWGNMMKPSKQEGAYGNIMTRMYQPTQGSGAYQGYQNWAGNDNVVSNAYGGVQSYMGQGTGLSKALGQLPTGRSASENFYYNNAGQFTHPGSTQDFYNANKGKFGAPGQALSLLQGGDYDTRGRTEGLQLSDVNLLGEFAAGNQKRMMAPSRIDEGAGEIGGLYRSSDRTEGWSDSQLGSLAGPGMFEDFAAQTLADDNPYLERIRDKSNARLNQEMARRGSFKSGGAVDRLGNQNAELDAQIFAQKADLAERAQGMGLQRIGAGTGLAQAGDQGGLARGGALSGLAGQRDQELRDRETNMLAAQQAASQEAFGNRRLQLDLAGAADQTWLGRMSGKSGLAKSADDYTRSGQRIELDAAQGADDVRLRGLEGMGKYAGQADDARGADSERRLKYSALDDELGLKKQEFGYGSALDLGKYNLDKYGSLVDLGLKVDDGERSQLKSILENAGLVDDRREGRDSSALDYLMEATGGNIDILMQILGAFGQTEGNRINAGGDAINAGADFDGGAPGGGGTAPAPYVPTKDKRMFSGANPRTGRR